VFTVTLPLAGAPGSGMTGEYPATEATSSVPTNDGSTAIESS